MIPVIPFIQKYLKYRRYNKFTRHTNTNIAFHFLKLLSLLFAMIFLHSFAMMYFEKLSLFNAIWLSLTTITTVGYGEHHANSVGGRVSTIFFMYTVGISLLGVLIAEYMEYRLNKLECKHSGRWRWKNMHDHILIINTPNENTEEYLKRLICEIRATPYIGDMPIQILTRKYKEKLPKSISDLGVVHYSGLSEDSDCLQAININTAKYILLLARDSGDPISDSHTFDILSRINEIGSNAVIVAEAITDKNRPRLRNMGANAIVRPIRAYPELLIRAMIAPGTEEVLENMFHHSDDHLQRFDAEFKNCKWKDIVCSFITHDAGLPVAIIAENGVTVNPLADTVCSGSGLIALIKDKQKISNDLIKKCLEI